MTLTTLAKSFWHWLQRLWLSDTTITERGGRGSNKTNLVPGPNSGLQGATPLARAEFALDKGLIAAPTHLSRYQRIQWVYRSRPSSYWK